MRSRNESSLYMLRSMEECSDKKNQLCFVKKNGVGQSIL